MQTWNSRYLVAVSVTFIMILLSSCRSHIYTPDGPPKFYVDETRIANAVPKPEPMAKLGNMPFYNVNGKRYYTLRSYKNYDEIGIASWYGTKFHEHRTSSGEPYNMLAMTAAHKTLPLPTYVEVTNLKNKRKIIVKVNDRGPFADNRIIDLSYVAAKKLGMIGHGTTAVRVRAIDPATYGKPTYYVRNKARAPVIDATAAEHSLYLQVAVFKVKSNAIKLRQRLMAMLGTPVNITIPDVTSSYYRVLVGPVNDMASADRLTYRLNRLGFKPYKLGH